MRFFKLNSCTTEQVDDLALYLNEKMEKLFTAIHSLGVPVAYGIVSYKGQTNLVLGVRSKEAQEIVESFIKGVLTGIELVSFWCCIIKVDSLFSRILIYNHNQYENRRKTYGTESKIL